MVMCMPNVYIYCLGAIGLQAVCVNVSSILSSETLSIPMSHDLIDHDISSARNSSKFTTSN